MIGNDKDRLLIWLIIKMLISQVLPADSYTNLDSRDKANPNNQGTLRYRFQQVFVSTTAHCYLISWVHNELGFHQQRPQLGSQGDGKSTLFLGRSEFLRTECGMAKVH